MNEDSGNGAVVFILLDSQDSILHPGSCANSLHGVVIEPCASDSFCNGGRSCELASDFVLFRSA